jgi:hypothetical protein
MEQKTFLERIDEIEKLIKDLDQDYRADKVDVETKDNYKFIFASFEGLKIIYEDQNFGVILGRGGYTEN